MGLHCPLYRPIQNTTTIGEIKEKAINSKQDDRLSQNFGVIKSLLVVVKKHFFLSRNTLRLSG